MGQGKDFYAVLGVASTATADEIKKSYRKMAKKYHPDTNQNDPRAADRFKEISEAYNVLSDPDKRRQYDDMRRYGAFGGFGSGAGGGAPRGGRPGTSRPGSSGGAGSGGTYTEFDIGGLGGLGDIFSSMFGGSAARGTPRSRMPEQGQSVEVNLEVPFRTAVAGGKVPVEIEVSEPCMTCGGSGAKPGTQVRTCDECHGRGTISFGQGGFAVNRPCPKCLGKGQIPAEPCAACNGSGEVRSRRKLSVNVPPASDSGSRIRLKGQGGMGSNGGPAGDLLINLQVKPDRFYRREGLDLIAPVPINIAQATLGSKISVKSLDGKQVTVKIPPGTPSGKRFRVRGLGVEKGAERGDLIIETKIEVPEHLSEEQEKMMREFAEQGGLKY